MKRYYIVGKYQNKTEKLDCFDTLKEAIAVLKEYKLAYGPKWEIDIVLK